LSTASNAASVNAAAMVASQSSSARVAVSPSSPIPTSIPSSASSPSLSNGHANGNGNGSVRALPVVDSEGKGEASGSTNINRPSRMPILPPNQFSDLIQRVWLPDLLCCWP
jgi:hypothetical protein